MKLFISLIAGILFGFGMVLSGMVDPSIVTAFLDVFGHWKPDLAFVMIGALMIFIPSYVFIIKPSSKPLLAHSFSLPVKSQIDKQLIIGASLFGIGWGLLGVCPGPVVASVSSLNSEVIIFIFAMIIGFGAEKYLLSGLLFQK